MPDGKPPLITGIPDFPEKPPKPEFKGDLAPPLEEKVGGMARALHKHAPEQPTTKLGPHHSVHITGGTVEIQPPQTVSTHTRNTVSLTLGSLPAELSFSNQAEPSELTDPELTRRSKTSSPTFLTLTIGETTIAVDLREPPIGPAELTPEQLKSLAEFGNLLGPESVKTLIELEQEAQAELQRRHEEDLAKKAQRDEIDKAPFSLTIFRNPKTNALTVRLSEGLHRKAGLITSIDGAREIQPIDLRGIVEIDSDPNLRQTVSRGNGEEKYHAIIILDRLTGKLLITDASKGGTEVTNSISPTP